MYKALFALGYYGLMRVGELTASEHVIKARNAHMAINKDKLMIVLYSSKTHLVANRPQKVRITANACEKSVHYMHRHFCPFKVIRAYISSRDPYVSDEENFLCLRANLQ